MVAAVFVYGGALNFIFVVLWPHLSLVAMVGSGWIGLLFWVCLGIARYLQVLSRRLNH